MQFEIDDGLTPPTPTVMFTKIQSISSSTGRKSPLCHNRPMVTSVEQFKDVSNLKVNQRRSRSFTPVKSSLFLRSPELSPINPNQNSRSNESSFLEQSLTPGDYKIHDQSPATPVEFKVPPPLIKNEGTTPNRPVSYHHGAVKEFQSEDLNQTQSLDKSASHGYLNHKLEVRLILKNAGMQQYIEAFDKEKVDFEKFLSLCEEDLIRLGVERKLDRAVIFRIISDLNAN